MTVAVPIAEAIAEAAVAETTATAAASETAGVGGLISKLGKVGSFLGPLKSVASAFQSMGDSADEAGKKVERTFTKPLDEIETFSGKIKSVTDVNFDTLLGQALQLADHIHDVSRQTGIATTDLSVLNAAAGDNGTKLDTLAESLGSFGTAVNGALGDDSKMLETFNRLGVSMGDLQTKSPRDLLLEVANGLQKMEDGATRSAAAQELFGDKAQELLPTLVSLAGDGFKNAADEAGKMGRIVAGPTADAADQFDKNLNKLKGGLVGLGMSALNVAMPAITGFTNVVVTLVGWLEVGFTKLGSWIGVVTSGLTSAFGSMGNAIKAFGSAVKDAWSFDHPPNIAGAVEAQVNKDIDAARARTQAILHPDTLRPETVNRTPLHPKKPEMYGPPAPPAVQQPSVQQTSVHIDMPSYHAATHVEKATAPAAHAAELKEEVQLLPQVVSHMKEKLAAAEAASAAARHELETTERSAQLEALRAHAIMTTAEVQKAADLQRASALDDYKQKVEQHRRDAEAAAKDIDNEPKANLGDILAADEAKKKILERQRAQDATAEVQYQSKLTQISNQAETERAKSRAALHYNQRLEDLVNFQHFAEQLAPVLGVPIDKMAADMVAKHKAALEQMEKNNKRMAGEMGFGLTTAFDTILKGGNIDTALKSIVDKFRSNWSAAFGEMVNHWMSELQRVAEGKPKMIEDPKHPGQMIEDPNAPAPSPTAQKWAKGAMVAYEGATAAYGLYQAGQSGVGKGANALSGAAQGAMMGAQVGGVYGAVIGAVIGGLAGYLTGTDKQSEYKYGNPYIGKNGQVYMSSVKNMNDAEVKGWIAKIQEQYNSFWNGYVNILLRLPGSKLPAMEAINGKFQDNPSSKYLKHLDEWLNQTLPRKIADEFKSGMQKAFDAAGVKESAFQTFWAQAEAMDPKKALQFWSDLVEGLVAFERVKTMSTSFKGVAGDYAAARFQGDGENRRAGDSDFVSQLRTSTAGIFDIARQMVALTGPEKVAAWKQLGASVNDVMHSLQDYINRIGEAIRNVRQSFDDARLQMKLSQYDEYRDVDGNVVREADPNGKAKAMEDEVANLMTRIHNAASLGLTPEEVQEMSQRALGYLSEIYSLDPSEDAYKWWSAQVDALQKITEDSLTAMGNTAQTAVDKLLTELEPFKNWFLGLPVDLDAAMKLTEGAFEGFAAALAELTKAVEAAKPPEETTPTNPLPRPGPDIPDKDPYVPFYQMASLSSGSSSARSAPPPINVTVHVNGTNYGVDELQQNVTAAAVAGTLAAIQSDPTIIDHPYAVGS